MLTISPFLVIDDNININNERARKIRHDKTEASSKEKNKRAQRLKKNPKICLKMQHTQVTNVHIHELTSNEIQNIKISKS
jgi:hypothetical protein